MGRKLTIEFIKNVFAENNCKFLDDHYINGRHPHNYKCECENISKISYENFVKNKRCMLCSGTPKYSFEHVKNVFAENNCEFLDNEYKGSREKHRYKCNCGNISEIRFCEFKKGTRCMDCKGNKKHTLLEVRNDFAKKNCVFLDENYKNVSHTHRYLCKCGKESKISFSNFKKGQYCFECSGRKKWDISSVCIYVKNSNCLFLDNFYNNNRETHRFRCHCGEEFVTVFERFISGVRCSNCAKSGFNNSDPAYLYLISRPNQFKIGIYNAGTKRLNEHKKYGWQLIEQKYFEKGIEAYEEEQKLLKLLDNNKIPRGKQAFKENFERGGYTEAWNDVDLTVISLYDMICKLRNNP
jgi:hypothetical protein